MTFSDRICSSIDLAIKGAQRAHKELLEAAGRALPLHGHLSGCPNSRGRIKASRQEVGLATSLVMAHHRERQEHLKQISNLCA